MSRILTAAIFAGTVCVASQAQTTDRRKLEFEAASVKNVPAPTGFRAFSPDTGSGGPGTPDPGMFRCGTCTLAALIGRAFHLQDYQFPGRGSLPSGNFEVAARIPPSASEEEFEAMLQSLLKDRFGLTYHFDEKTMAGYHLVLAKGGARLKESTGGEPAKANGWGHGDGGHSHTGVLNFGGQARYQASDRAIGDLARVLSDELGRPVDDQTGLKGKYDIALSWSAESAGSSQHEHDAGGAEHAGHGGATATTSGDASGPGLGQALESQLGLKLVAGTKSAVRIFVVDHVEKIPASN